MSHDWCSISLCPSKQSTQPVRSLLGNENVAVNLVYLSRGSFRARRILINLNYDSRLYIMKFKDKVFINLVQIPVS